MIYIPKINKLSINKELEANLMSRVPRSQTVVALLEINIVIWGPGN